MADWSYLEKYQYARDVLGFTNDDLMRIIPDTSGGFYRRLHQEEPAEPYRLLIDGLYVLARKKRGAYVQSGRTGFTKKKDKRQAARFNPPIRNGAIEVQNGFVKDGRLYVQFKHLATITGFTGWTVMKKHVQAGDIRYITVNPMEIPGGSSILGRVPNTKLYDTEDLLRVAVRKSALQAVATSVRALTTYNIDEMSWTKVPSMASVPGEISAPAGTPHTVRDQIAALQQQIAELAKQAT